MMQQGPLSGQMLGGKYLLGELVGKGGFGSVYKAENQMLHRQQAIKVLLEEHFGDEKFRERFLREARTLAALDHANIVHVDDIGMEGHLIYLVMPYISGGTLQDIMKARSGPLGLEEITRSLEQICSALGYAHAHGIVHLDLKPLNLLVHQDGRLLLSDFGLAHLMGQGAIDGGTSLQFGSPLYMAPEHFEGKPGQQSDIYALGVILYQMLTGQHPFEGATPAAIMRKHLTEPPPPLRTVRPDLPAALDAVLAKALAKQPEQRYGRAGELLVDFRAALAGEPAQVAQPLAYEPTLIKQAPPAMPAGMSAPGQGPMTPPGPPSGPPGQPVMAQAPWPPGGPIAPPPGYVRMPEQPPRPLVSSGRIWTPGFTVTFVLVAAGGGLLTLISFLLGTFTFLSLAGLEYTIIRLLLWLGLAVVALLGVFSTQSGLLRLGFIVQIIAMGCDVLASFLFILADVGAFNALLTSAVETLVKTSILYLPFAVCLFQGVSLVLLSYGLAGWRSSPDAGLTALHIGLTALILVAAAILGFDPQTTFEAELGSAGFVWAGIAGSLFALLVLLLRPRAWKQQPMVVISLAAGAVLFLVSHTLNGFGLLSTFLPFLDRLSFSLTNGLFFLFYMLAYALLICGVLLLGQTERARKRAQQAVPAPALAGPAS